MRALCAWAAGLAVVATTATGASPVVEITTIGARGRTSLVLLSDSPVQSAKLAQKDPRTVVLTGTLDHTCEPVRRRSTDSAALVAVVTVECNTPHDFVATIVTRGDVMPAVRAAGRRLYVDLTPGGTPSETAVRAQPAGRPAPATPSAAATPPDVYSRAAALAATGNVRELATLMARLTPEQRRDEQLMLRLDALVQAAQQRRLELDRALFTNGASGDRR